MEAALPESTMGDGVSETVDVGRLTLLHRAAEREGVPYRLGHKPRAMCSDCSKAFPSGVDCSGYVRWLLVQGGLKSFPNGSTVQRRWCEWAGWKRSNYRLNAMWRDKRLRIAFIRPNRLRPGHVWLVWNGQTMESFSGRGVGSRSWASPGLLARVSDCFIVPTT
jgi:hypothetical protein